MLAAGVRPAEADLGLKDDSACQTGDRSFKVGDPPRAMIGVHAGTFYGSFGTMGGGGGAGCWVYLYEDGAGWHFDSARCAQATGSTPGVQSLVWVSGCANVRAAPGTSADVLDCLKGGTIVDVDSAPVYADARIWWHLAGRGWMAHEFLIEPKKPGTPF